MVKMEEGDLLITCRTCQVIFLFGGNEREYFEKKELQQPRHCAPCRRARREGRQFSMDVMSREGSD